MKSPQTAIVPQRHVHFLAILTCLLTYFAPLWMGASPLWGQDTKRVKEITEWLNEDKMKQNRIRTELNRAREKAKAEKKDVFLDLNHMFLTNKDLKKIFFLITEGSEWKGLTSKIVSIELNCNYLETLPPTLGCFSSLVILTASANKIKEIPLEIVKLKKLEWLKLNRNQIMELPREIGMLKELDLLGLNQNQIIELPREIAKLKKLRYLKLESNPLESFPLEMASLEEFNFYYFFYRAPNNLFFTEPPSEVRGILSAAIASSEGKCRWKSDVREKIYTFLAALRHQYSPQFYKVMKTLTKEHLSPMLPSNYDEHFELYVGGKKVKHLYIPRAFFRTLTNYQREHLFRGAENKYARVDASAISGLGHRLIVNFLKQNPNHEIYYD